MGETRKAYTILIEKQQKRKPFWIPSRRLEDSIKIDLDSLGVDLIRLAQDKVCLTLYCLIR
jgi:hypothetical protein